MKHHQRGTLHFALRPETDKEMRKLWPLFITGQKNTRAEKQRVLNAVK